MKASEEGVGVAPVLRVEDLRVEFPLPSGVITAVDGVSLELRPGEALAVVGESGSGKSTLARALIRLVPPPGRIVGGRVLVGDEDILACGEATLRRHRGGTVGFVFQDPTTFLNPVFRVGEQIADVVALHRDVDARAAWAGAVDALRKVEIPSPELRAHQYPHQLSGGMRQRALTGMAISCDQRLLVADEPTTALDVITQAQVLELLRRLKRETGLAILLITHDLGVAAAVADRVAVMYAGRIAETGPIDAVLREPRHPYTALLLQSIPPLDRDVERLPVIGGGPSRGTSTGCPFRDRCPRARAECAAAPPLAALGEQAVACWFPVEYGAAA